MLAVAAVAEVSAAAAIARSSRVPRLAEEGTGTAAVMIVVLGRGVGVAGTATPVAAHQPSPPVRPTWLLLLLLVAAVGGVGGTHPTPLPTPTILGRMLGIMTTGVTAPPPTILEGLPLLIMRMMQGEVPLLRTVLGQPLGQGPLLGGSV